MFRLEDKFGGPTAPVDQFNFLLNLQASDIDLQDLIEEAQEGIDADQSESRVAFGSVSVSIAAIPESKSVFTEVPVPALALSSLPPLPDVPPQRVFPVDQMQWESDSDSESELDEVELERKSANVSSSASIRASLSAAEQAQPKKPLPDSKSIRSSSRMQTRLLDKIQAEARAEEIAVGKYEKAANLKKIKRQKERESVTGSASSQLGRINFAITRPRVGGRFTKIPKGKKIGQAESAHEAPRSPSPTR